jgi:uncharacterized protein
VSESCIYEGAVRHRRFEIRRREFRHRLALMYLDLDELPTLLGGRLVAARPKLVHFRRADYLGDPRTPLSDAVRTAVEQRTGHRPNGPIRLLTHLRSYGHCFNPVSFYYCFDASGARLEHVIAEVTNTPWGERHAYVLSNAADATDQLTGSSTKELHVSPFMAMEHRYDWRVSAPTKRLEVHIETHRANQLAFDATLCLRRHELTRRNLAKATARYPFATLRVLALIYSHAVRLKLKGVPVYRHPKNQPA